MITASGIFIAFLAGGCAGLLLIALLRTATDQSLDASARSSAYNRIEGEQGQRRTDHTGETLADAFFPVPLYVIAAAAPLG